MSIYCCLSVIVWALSLIATSASPTTDLTFSSYNDAGLTEVETLRILRRTLSASGTKDTVNLFDETLDKSWDGAVLFAITMEPEEDASTGVGNSSLDINYGVQIVCSTCYIAGRVSGQLTRNADFNVTELEESAIDLVKNITEEAGQALSDLVDGNANYTEIDFNVDLPSFPDFDYQLQFRLDNLELYMKLDTILSVESSYTINLYTSETPVGYSLGDHLEIGAFFTVDLILTAAAEVDISSGVHLKVDGAGINLQMFNKSVDSITLDGGMFEFLPVNVEGAGFVLTGALRVGLHAGIAFDVDSSITIGNYTLGASAGLEAGVFANIAQFVANVTYDSGNDDCELAIVESFTVGLGAAAGASAAFDQTTWGPTPETDIPIWYTELGSACAAHRSSTTTLAGTTSALITARDATSDLSLTLATVTTETTSSGVACISPGLINCPVSLQTTKTFTATLTSTTSVPYGSEATWPATTSQTPVKTVAFGSNAKALSATTGSPVSYVPPPPPSSSSSTSSPASGATATGSQGSHEDHKPLIIGLSVGLGVPALAIIVGVMVYFLKRWHRYMPVQKAESESHVTEELQPASQHEQQVMLKRMTTVEVDETA